MRPMHGRRPKDGTSIRRRTRGPRKRLRVPATATTKPAPSRKRASCFGVGSVQREFPWAHRGADDFLIDANFLESGGLVEPLEVSRGESQ